MNRRRSGAVALAAAVCLWPAALHAAPPAVPGAAGTRLVRQPAIGENGIVFVYANDLWRVGREGGVARRLTSAPGTESDPHFSPDGRWVAFTGQYAGNVDVYLIPSGGGEPRRLTWHPAADEARGFTPDGRHVLFASARLSPFGSDNVPMRQLFTIPVEGGLPERLPIPDARRGAFAFGGPQAARESERWQEEWRNYRGGQAQPIRILSLGDRSVRAVPGPRSQNRHPVWLGGRLYFLSDRGGPERGGAVTGGRMNVYEFDPAGGAVRSLTHHEDFDVKWLEAGGGLLVYEQGGFIYTLDPAGSAKRLVIEGGGDFAGALPE